MGRIRKRKEENVYLLTTYYVLSAVLGAFYVVLSANHSLPQVEVTLSLSLNSNSTIPMTLSQHGPSHLSS